MLPVDLQRLCRRINYEFKNLAYLKQALTHRSASNDNNERFEFLGDSILSFVIANALFERFPDEPEGKLSRLRSFLVKGDMLADIALELQLGDYLYLGQGELRSGGFRRASILADALEAVIAAVFLDSGIAPAQALILRLYDTRLNDDTLQNNLKDDKTRLQEFLQAAKKSLPAYELVQVEGDEHDQVFHIDCSVQGFSLITKGAGSSRRKAEQEAALQMYLYLKENVKGRKR